MSALNMTVAVIVTFNRSAKLMKVLDAIERQTLRPDIVLVVDNASTDDTPALIEARATKDDTIRHLRLPKNVGGAGGFHAGMKAAYQMGAQYFWISDDDAYPEPEAIERLHDALDRFQGENGYRPSFACSRVEWIDGTLCEMNCPRPVWDWARFVHPRAPWVLVDSCSFVSALIPRWAVTDHGLASQTHNVVVATFRGGELLEQFLPHCCNVLITENPLREMPYVGAEAFQKIDFAILNSVECALFIHPLVARDIPFAAYVHEYADYTFPAWKSVYMTAFADLLVFSSEHVRDSWKGQLTDIVFDTANDSMIIPQHPLVEGEVTEVRRLAARDHLSKVLGRDLSETRLICGAGHVQWRKGTDIFVQAAQACAKDHPDTVFVWIGDGQNHQDMGFGVWFDYHLRQAGANRKDSNIFFLPAGPLYPDVMDAADAMFLSSRLDPLPNVVFDAVQRGCRVVCFEGATGFADTRYHGSARIVRTPYAEPGAAVNALMALPRKTGLPNAKVMEPCGQGPSLFNCIRGALEDRLARQRNFVCGESAFDIPLLFTKADKDRPLRRREREKLFSYGRRLLWRDVEDVRATVEGSDNWIHRRLQLEDYRPTGADDPQVPSYAIHIHAFYIDDLAAEFRDYAAFAHAARILVTTDTEAKAKAIRQMGSDQGLTIETQLVPNQGRDILPFLRLFGRDGVAGDDLIWCHLHQKKSVQTTSHGDVWRRFLHRILLGDQEMLSSAIGRIAQPGVGLVAPFEPHFVGWNDSRRLLPAVADHFPGPFPDNPLLFPVGNMFWTRADVAREMLELFGEDHAWPNEPIPTDGTEFHLIERLWPAVAARMDLESFFIYKRDEARV